MNGNDRGREGRREGGREGGKGWCSLHCARRIARTRPPSLPPSRRYYSEATAFLRAFQKQDVKLTFIFDNRLGVGREGGRGVVIVGKEG